MFGIEEAVKEAQAGGSGVVIYFRKEGRALGEVTKYLVYNVRKRTGDKATQYFASTEGIAGVKDVSSPRYLRCILTIDAFPSVDA
jgi:GTP cyclohydrolase II